LTIANFSTCPQISSETYKGVLVGDVDGNYATVSPNGMFREGGGNKIIVDVSNSVVNENHLDVPVYTMANMNVNALDLVLNYNENDFTFNSVVNNTGYVNALANFNVNDRILRLTSSSLQQYENDKSLFYLRFDLHSVQPGNLNLNSVEGYLNGNRVGVEFSKSEAEPTTKDVLINIYPNPAKNILNVVVSSDVTIQFYDLDGRQVLDQANLKANEKTEIYTHNLANGIYFVRIGNDEFISIKKVVVEN